MGDGRPLVVLVGHDAAPSNAFENHVASALESRGWRVAKYLGFGKNSLRPQLEQILRDVENANFVLGGMSVPQGNADEEEAALNHARKKAIPYGFYADQFGAWGRPWFSHLAANASVLLVLNVLEADKARTMYPRAHILVAGNHEWEDASFPKYSRGEIRSLLGISLNSCLGLVVGHKEMAITAYSFMSTVHALHQSPLNGAAWHVILSPHPGDGVPPRSYSAPVLWSDFPVEIITKTKDDPEGKRYQNASDKKEPELKVVVGGFTTSELLPGADFLIESASTFCHAAAILGIPIISVLTEISKSRNKVVMMQREWEPVRQGIAWEVTDNPHADQDNLTRVVQNKFLSEKNKKELLSNQARQYPRFAREGEFGRSIAAMIDPYRNL